MQLAADIAKYVLTRAWYLRVQLSDTEVLIDFDARHALTIAEGLPAMYSEMLREFVPD